MSHRTTADDRERVRRGHFARLDPEIADRVMSRDYRTASPLDRDVWDRYPVADPRDIARLRRDLDRTAVVPDALTAPCPEHDAAPGTFCFRGARGVCAPRLAERTRRV